MRGKKRQNVSDLCRMCRNKQAMKIIKKFTKCDAGDGGALFNNDSGPMQFTACLMCRTCVGCVGIYARRLPFQ